MLKNKKSAKKRKMNENIDSDIDEYDDTSKIDDCNDTETAQDKKIRLAKSYIKQIQLESGNNEDYVSQQFKQDYLKSIGRSLNSFGDQFVSCDVDHLTHLKTVSTVTCMCLTNDNQFLLTGSKKCMLTKWSLKTGKIESVKKFQKNDTDCHQKQINCIAISYDDQFIAVGDETNVIRIWSADFKLIKKLQGHRKAVTGLSFRHNSLDLYSASKDKTVRIWTLKEMMEIETLFGHEHNITSIDCAIGGSDTNVKVITSGGQDCTIRVWKIVTESQLVFFTNDVVVDVAKFVNSEYFVAGNNNGDVSLWKCDKKKPIFVQKSAHATWIVSLAVLANSNLMASGASDGNVIVWKINNFKTLNELMKIQMVGFINSMCFTTDSRMLIAAVGNEHRFGRWGGFQHCNSVVTIPVLLKDK